MAAGWCAVVPVLRLKWPLVRRHRRLAAAWIGLLFVPAAYALIELSAVWDPVSRKVARGRPDRRPGQRDAGARYRHRELNLGAEVLAAIERDGRFGYRRFSDAAQAFAPEAARQVNTRLSEARWELVLCTAAGSQRSVVSLRQALAGLNAAANELTTGARRAPAAAPPDWPAPHHSWPGGSASSARCCAG